MPRMKLLEPFNCRPIGAVVNVSLQIAAQLEKDKIGVETDEPESFNPGATPDEPERRDLESVDPDALVKPRRGRPPKNDDAE